MAKKKIIPPIYQLIIELKHIKPRIWRRIQVVSTITLHDLHEIIQNVMGWSNTHLYAFDVKGIQFTKIDEFEDMDGEDAEKMTLDKVLKKEKAKVLYNYDFGDDWMHDVILEKIVEPKMGISYPICIGGKRSSPPEDCGGPWGYEELLQILKNPKHPEYKERKEWVGPYFEPELFDLEQINKDIDFDREQEKEPADAGYNTEKVDEMMLGLLLLNMFEEKGGIKAWKFVDLGILERLHKKGYLSSLNKKEPVVSVSEEGVQKAREIFEEYFKK